MVIKMLAVMKGEDLESADPEYIAELLTLPPKYKYARFSAQARKYVADKLGVTTASVNNHIYSILKKGYAYRDGDGVIYFTPLIERLSEIPSELTLKFIEERTSS